MKTRYVAGRVYNHGGSVGRGLGGGQGLSTAVDVAVGSDEAIYVVNKGTEYMPNTGVSKCTLDHKFVWDNRGFSFGAGPFPTSIALDKQENVYVSDDYVNKIFVLDKDGEPLGYWPEMIPVPPLPHNPPGLDFSLYEAKLNGGMDGDGDLNGPSGLAFDKDENLHIVDSHNHRVQVFAKDGAFLRKFGSRGIGDGELNLPWGIAIDDDSNIYVADWGNDRVQKFSSGGEYLASFGRSGSGDGELDRPTSVAVDDEGDVYVTDWGNNRLNIYDAEGEFITAFYGDADVLSPSHQAQVDANPDVKKARMRTDISSEMPFARPMSVKIASEGRILVVESLRSRMQLYIKEKDWIEPQFNL